MPRDTSPEQIRLSRAVKPALSQAKADQLASRVVAHCWGTMSLVIGDNTPAQCDRADKMAEGIASAVKRALVEMGLAEDD